MKGLKTIVLVLVGCVMVVCAGTASALTVNPLTGEIENWDVMPFTSSPYGDWSDGPPPEPSGIAGTAVGETANMAWVEGNNVAPIDYAGTPDYIPAPGINSGEAWDAEFLAWRLTGGTIQVLGVTSLDPNNGADFEADAIHLGDVFIDVDGDDSTGYNGYDLALTAGQWSTPLNDPLHVGEGPYDHLMEQDLYAIGDVDDVHGITDDPGYGYLDAVTDVANPFAVREGATMVADATFDAVMHDYGIYDGRNEDGTWILEWELDVSALLPYLAADNGVDLLTLLGQMELHWTVECGNDIIDRGPREDPVIPEPASLALIGLGLASMGFARRRRR